MLLINIYTEIISAMEKMFKTKCLIYTGLDDILREAKTIKYDENSEYQAKNIDKLFNYLADQYSAKYFFYLVDDSKYTPNGYYLFNSLHERKLIKIPHHVFIALQNHLKVLTKIAQKEVEPSWLKVNFYSGFEVTDEVKHEYLTGIVSSNIHSTASKLHDYSSTDFSVLDIFCQPNTKEVMRRFKN